MRPLDWTVLLVLMALIVGDGLRHGRKTRNVKDYFLAGHRMRGWAIGLSVMATQASAITLLSITGHGFEHGLHWLHVYYALPFAMVILCTTVVPWFRRRRLYTAYEYLEQRFDRPTRVLASLLFLVSRGLAVGTYLYAPSFILGRILGVPQWQSILIMGGLAVAYTWYGGLRAVISTDVKQMVLLAAAVAVSLWAVLARLPEGLSFGGALEVAGASAKLQAVRIPGSLREVLAERYNLFSGLLGGLFLFLGYFGADQSQVQRFLSGRTVRDARQSLLLSAYLKVPMQLVILMIGVLLFVVSVFEPAPLSFRPTPVSSGREADYQRLEQRYDAVQAERAQAAWELLARRGSTGEQPAAERLRDLNGEVRTLREQAAALHGGGVGAASEETDFVYPWFVLREVPAGWVGVIVAGIFAAAMSSLDSALSSLATSTVMDLAPRRRRDPQELLRISRAATLGWGAFATVTAFWVGRLGAVIEAVNLIGSMFYGSLFGVFVLGRALPRARGAVGWISLLVGFLGVLFTHFIVNARTVVVNGVEQAPVGFLWYNLIGFAGVLASGFLLSRLPRRPGAIPVTAPRTGPGQG